MARPVCIPTPLAARHSGRAFAGNEERRMEPANAADEPGIALRSGAPLHGTPCILRLRRQATRVAPIGSGTVRFERSAPPARRTRRMEPPGLRTPVLS